MNVSPEKWIDLLTLYGPMALFVFMVFVLLGRARAAAPGLSPAQRRVQVYAYVFVWLSIFVLAGMIVLSWWRINFPSEYVVSGTIHNLKYPQMITTDEQLFLHRRTVAGLDFEYEWRFISAHRFTGTIELLLQKRPSDVKVLSYQLPIRSEFYQGTVDISFDQRNDKMVLRHETQIEELDPSPALIPSATLVSPLPGTSTFGQVYAAAIPQAKPEDLILALDADDPLIRAAARRDLIKLGPSSILYLDKVLTNPASSYRLRVGTFSTLQGLVANADKSLSLKAKCEIARASRDSDPTLSAEASCLIAKGIRIPTDCGQVSGVNDKSNPGCVVLKIQNNELGPVRAFQRYVELTDARSDKELKEGADILWIDSLSEPGRTQAYEALKRGEIKIERLETRDNGERISCPGAMIHHWAGIVFIPGAKLQEVLTILQDYDHHAQYYAPDVERSQIESQDNDHFLVFLRFRRHKVITVVLNTEHDIRYFHDSETRAHSRSSAVRIAEVENAGKGDEREKSPGEDSGFLRRMETWWRVEERDGGVYVQSEVVSLTRDIPAGLGWLIGPFVMSVPKETLTFTLEATRKAVETRATAFHPRHPATKGVFRN